MAIRGGPYCRLEASHPENAELLEFEVHHPKSRTLRGWAAHDLAQPACLEVLHGLDELLLGVHDERPVARERLPKRSASEQQQLGALRRGQLDQFAVTQNRQLPFTHLATRDLGHTREDVDEALERGVDALVDLRAGLEGPVLTRDVNATRVPQNRFLTARRS